MSGLHPVPLLEALQEEGVDYVLVGGLAAAMMGTTRITRDIDLAYATHQENLERLCAAINRFKPRHLLLGKPEGTSFDLAPNDLRKHRIVQLATSIGQIDLIDRIAGFKSYGELKSYAVEHDIGFPVRVLATEGLLKAKRAMKRPKDVQDIVELEALQEAQTYSHHVRLRPEEPSP